MLRVAENLTPPSFQSNPQKFQQRVNVSPSERILVVEDDHAVQKALRRLFEAEGYAVQVAPDGNAAVESFKTTAPSAVVAGLRVAAAGGRGGRRAVKQKNPAGPTLLIYGNPT